MPYQWRPPMPEGPEELRVWPHRSLTRRGFVAFIAVTSALIALPLVGLVGTPVLWGVLPFLLAAVAAIWAALRRSERDREILEVLTLGPDNAHLVRRGPRSLRQDWQANSHLVQVILHDKDGPVPNYLTLRGGPREVELGSFLTEAERLSLHQELRRRLSALRPAP